MKQQIILIHGGNVFTTYKEYLENLKTKELTLERILAKGWKSNLESDLGDTYQVLAPKMPNAQNAKYLEWKIWFEKLIPLLEDEVILIGHSLGGIFLVKYLAENTYPKHINATFLIAAPYVTSRHSLADFGISTSLDAFAHQAGSLFLYHSKDDVVVPFENGELYHKKLPSSVFRVFKDRQHFTSDSFPELIEDIKKLSSNP